MASEASKNYERKYKFVDQNAEVFEKTKTFTKKYVAKANAVEKWIQKDEYFEKTNDSSENEYSNYDRVKVRTMTSLLTKQKTRQLIAYNRPNSGENHQESNYVKITYDEGNVSDKKIESTLASFYKPSRVVEKERTVFLYKNTRIHLDDVKAMGYFLEFEYVVPKENKFKDDHDDVYSFLTKKYRLHDLSAFERIYVSYSDLVVPQTDK